MLFRSLILRVASWKWVERFVRGSGVMRRVVRRFVAGDTVDEAIAVAENLANEGYLVTLDLLGEHAAGPVNGDAALGEYMELLERIAASPHGGGSQPERVNISIKLSQLGLVGEPKECESRLMSLLTRARDDGNFVRVDMEESALTEATLDLVRKCFDEVGHVGVAIQAMLKRTPDDVADLNRRGIRIRLVKGAYMESASVALQGKRAVNEAYVSVARDLLEHGTYPAFGTHDAKVIAAVQEHARNKDLASSSYEFQMLYGIRRQLQERLKSDGQTVRVYVPYGTSWYPYFTRRLAERPANLLFFIRALFGK